MIELGFNSREYFYKLQFDVWIRFDSIPVSIFLNIWDYIDEPNLRPSIRIDISGDYTAFKKTWIYGRDID